MTPNRPASWLVIIAALLQPVAFALEAPNAMKGSRDATDSRVAAAELALGAGNCREGAEAYQRVAARSRDLRLVRRATEVAVACDHLSAAWNASQRWAALDPENIDALRANGMVAVQLYKVADARRVFGALLKKPDVEPDRALQELLPDLSDGAKAHAAWAVLSNLVDPAALQPSTGLALAELAIAADNLTAARRIVEAVLQTEITAGALRQLARLLAAEGDTARALQTAREAVTAAGDDPEHAFALAEVLIDLDRNEEAYRELLRAQEVPVTADEADRRLALLAVATGDFDEARRRFAARLQRGASSAESFFYLGVIAERTGQSELALQSYLRLAGAGAGLMPRARAGALLIKLGRRDEAFELLDEFLRQDPQGAIDVAIARAELLLAADAGDAAVEELQRALQAYPGHPQLEYQLAMVFERSGRHAESIRSFEQFLKQRPDDPTALNALGYTLADNGKELPRAERLVRQALEAMPDNAAAIDSLAWILYRRGDAPAALPLLERAYALSRDAEIAAHWGEVLWVLGEQGQARTVWARALARAPDSEPLKTVIARFAAAAPDSASPDSTSPAPTAEPTAL